MKWLLIFFQTKKLVIHLIDDFHVLDVPTKPTDKTNAAIHMASSLPVIATRVNELGDSFNKGIIEQDTSSNIADSHNSHEQPENQPVIHASRYSNFYKSHDGGNKITRNLEQLIMPQPSVPDRTTQERGYSTERSASVANSHQNHVLI